MHCEYTWYMSYYMYQEMSGVSWSTVVLWYIMRTKITCIMWPNNVVSILRPPMGPRKYGLILQVVLNKGQLTQNIALWDKIKRSYKQGWS